MDKRIASVDALRGITIFMMILCSTIGWNSGLPAWMFHCQCPPPTYAFDPAVKGITWVDLVFPWFLFSMGAAIPFALGSRLRKGASVGQVSLGIVKRWLTLAAFGLVLGNSYLFMDYSDLPRSLVRLGIWCGLFLALWRVPKNAHIPGWAVSLAGWLVVIAMLFVGKAAFDAPLGLHHIDIIIMVMSLVALAGGFAWLLTREKPLWRLVLLLVVFATKEINWQTGAFGVLNFPYWIDWLLNWRYMQYLFVILLGTFVGDMLSAASRAGEPLCAEPRRGGSAFAAIICLLTVPLALWGFFTRNIWMLLAAVAVCTVTAHVLTARDRSVWASIMRIGFAALMLGIIFDPIDGGITKDHCNMSYMLSSGGLACLMTSFLLWCESHAALRGRTLSRNFTMTGQNPMIAYTVTGFIILPVVSLFKPDLFAGLIEGNPVLGALRGLVITCMMVALTCLCTKNKIFWRS